MDSWREGVGSRESREGTTEGREPTRGRSYRLMFVCLMCVVFLFPSFRRSRDWIGLAYRFGEMEG
jgi:hypothetical protein